MCLSPISATVVMNAYRVSRTFLRHAASHSGAPPSNVQVERILVRIVNGCGSNVGEDRSKVGVP